jgi:hypothetical protein
MDLSPSLMINGENPLLLQYAPLSEGIHGKRDEECLDIGFAVKVVCPN